MMADRVIRTRLEYLLYAAMSGWWHRPLGDSVAAAEEFQPEMLASNNAAHERATSLAREFAREQLPDQSAGFQYAAEIPAGFLDGECAILGGEHIRLTKENGRLVARSTQPVQVVEMVPLREFHGDGEAA